MAYRQRTSRRLPFESVRPVKNQGRAHPNNDFYNKRKWRKYSRQFRHENRICIRCQRIISDISYAVTEHLIRINLGGSKWDERNHAVMHKGCHSIKSSAESRGLELPRQKNESGEYIPVFNELFYKLLRE